MNQNSELGTWTPASEEIFLNRFPLHRACRDGDYEALGSLLSATGDQDFYLEDSFYGWTPIHWAAYFGKLCCLRKIITILGSRVCDIPTSKFRQTPFHLSAQSGEPHCLQWLVQSGNCNINLQDYMGETPVHKAARIGSMECVSLLVSQGAKLSIRNHSGNTPSQVAVLSGHQECGNYLEKALQIHQQANLVHEEMRNHVTQPISSPSNISSSTDMSEVSQYAVQQGLYGNFIPQPIENNNIHENGQILNSNSHTGPPKQYVSTDYQGTTIFVQSGVASMPNGVTPMLNGIVTENNNLLASHDCEMETEAEGTHNGQICNGMSNGLHNGGYGNGVASGGMKRCRDDMDDGFIKRARSEGPDLKQVLTMQSCWTRKDTTNCITDHRNSYPYVNGQSQNHEIHQQSFDNQVMPTISTSLIEHYCSVTAQQGYDSLLASSLIPH
ncbi:hypothetical protein CHS0354_025199 [Potamilus streckersoni]|uniref:Ankyrin repeat domain-containing protein 10 n=1 Tax=Potamilus streckersoni TaxID=2493646 RepID=A0AAE0VGW8_9BIVA|nr:hypothetical protein CHS0354_025199 [Potamilus streckersoni]